ncbi:ATP-binding protein [Paenibacillus sp. GXUN7292]|uniref:hybrid sensor histidine kinase/response regulator n=1 Tax=Paenibacillus sp. GXUN7292 TaxID=3422499 RepID=UPI003D7DDF8C
MPSNKPLLHKWKIPIISLAFIAMLTGLRIIWIDTFNGSDYPDAINGVLDLRNYSADSKSSITLDGQWEFYPHRWLAEEQLTNDVKSPSSSGYIKVPSGWNSSLSEQQPTPFGYGSYRLQLLVDPAKEQNYSIRIPSVRSSSELYVNGRLLGSSGKPAEHSSEYIAHNIPYTVTFNTEGKESVEIIIQAANYTDPRDSGIIRSIRLGSELTIYKETQISIAMQVLVAAAFLIHMIYPIILYFLGYRDVKLLYFSLLIFVITIAILMSSEDKILLLAVPIKLNTGFAINMLVTIFGTYALFRCLDDFIPPKIFTRIHPWLLLLTGISTCLVFILPASEFKLLQPIYVPIVLTILLSVSFKLIKSAFSGVQINIWLLLAIISVTNYMIWYMIIVAEKIKILYYPLELIAATICFATIWLRRYYLKLIEAGQLSEKLRKSDKQKDEFLAQTSHELRNPLHSILNISQTVLERERRALSHKSTLDIELVLTIGRRMSLLLDDLIDMSRLKDSHINLQMQAFKIQSVANGVIDMLQFMVESRPIRLVNQIEDSLPPVFGDEKRVVQILFNLLHNAIKFTPQGEISIGAFVQNNRAYITVLDSGIGIHKEAMDRVFEPYEQEGSTAAADVSGFGLGLHISKQLAELHGGSLHIETEPGQGSCFTFDLQLADESSGSAFQQQAAAAYDGPKAQHYELLKVKESIQLKQQHEEHEEYEDYEWESNSTPISADRGRILIIDDDPVNLKVLANIIDDEHYELTTTTSAAEALDLLHIQEWDLIISDVMMPQMSGYELTRKVRKRYSVSDLPILLLTARNRSEDIKNGFRAGANDYVTKPVDATELRSRVQALTQVRKTARDRLRVEAAWLQAQIQPHFLFNTLNAIAALSTIDMERMRKLIDAFSQFLRDKFSFQNMDEWIPIDDELNIVRSYLYIEQERFLNRLQVVWEVDVHGLFMVPPLTIQPLVENAVKHGIMKQAGEGKIYIRIKNRNDDVEISISDNGVGMSEEFLNTLFHPSTERNSGIGLINTHLRLKRHFGSGLQISSKLGYGTTVSFVVRKQRA